MSKSNRRAFLGMLGGTAALAGCETVGEVAAVVFDPDAEVVDANAPSKVTLNSYAAENLNIALNGAPTPVVVKIFALSSDHLFYGFDFFSLTIDSEEVLGPTLTEFLDEISMDPDSFKINGPYEMPPRTKYLGVIAEFQDVDRSTWRATIDVEATGADQELIMLLLSDEVRLQKEG